MIVIPLIGALMLALGLFGLAWPRAAIGRVERWWRSTRGLQIAILLRFGFGVLLIVQASATRYPRSVGVLGICFLAAAIGLGLLGYRRLRAWIEWWVDQPGLFIRILCLAPCLLGAFLIHAAPLGGMRLLEQ